MKITEKSQAFKKRFKSFEVTVVESVDPAKQLYLTTPDVAKEIETLLLREGGMKTQVSLHVTFKKKRIVLGSEGQSEEVFECKNAYFNSKAFTILNKEEIIDALDKTAKEINNKIAVWLSEGSGWTIEMILRHYINIVKYLPLRGNSYLQLPVELRNSKKGLINIKNEDDKCFLWSHNRHLNPLKIHPERITQSDKELAKKLHYSGITFPVTINQIAQIERQNEININVFGYNSETKSVFPIRLSREHYHDHMELLYIEGEVDIKKREGNVIKVIPVQKKHYVYIKDFNSLMYSFTKMKCRKHFCMHCLQGFYSSSALEEHKEDCIVINGACSSY